MLCCSTEAFLLPRRTYIYNILRFEVKVCYYFALTLMLFSYGIDRLRLCFYRYSSETLIIFSLYTCIHTICALLVRNFINLIFIYLCRKIVEGKLKKNIIVLACRYNFLSALLCRKANASGASFHTKSLFYLLCSYQHFQANK